MQLLLLLLPLSQRGFGVIVLLITASVVSACTNITVNFSTSQSGSCIPKTVQITNNSSGSLAASAVYELYLDGVLKDTSHGTSKTFSLSLHRGAYLVKLKSIDGNGCIDSSEKTVTIAKPRIEFTGNPGGYSETPEWANCIQQNTDPDSFLVTTKNKDSINSVKIVWGDGNSNTFSALPKDSVISHLYVSTGSFTTYFITTDTGGCVDTTIGLVINERIPTAGIVGPNSGFNVGCAPFAIKFVNNSSNISNGTIFTWTFGDGKSLTRDNTTYNQAYTHTYSGTLCNGTVRLVASNACGFSQTTWNPIQVSKVDKALFEIDSSNCDTSGVFTFVNNSTDSFCIFPDSKQYYWDFGDGTNSGWISSNGNVTHSYKVQGPKKVCLIAKNKCGNDTMCQTFNVVYTPVIGFVSDTLLGCGSVKVTVRDTSTGYGLSRLWEWGDGDTSYGAIDSHLYLQRGKYTLKLRVSNRCGARSATETVEIKDKPTANFTGESDGCAILDLSLKNATTTDFTNSINYYWMFGNGDTSTLANPPLVSYNDSGIYEIRLIANDTCGTDTISKEIEVYRLPEIDVSFDSVYCSLDTITFNNNSKHYDFLLIDYGDGSVVDSIKSSGFFKHVFQTSGSFQVIIKAINKTICETSDTILISIKPNSEAIITLQDSVACAPFTFQFKNDSKNASDFIWLKNDSFLSKSTQIDSITIHTDSTFVNLKLVAKDTIGCESDTFSQTFYTGKNPIASILKTTDSSCSPFNDTIVNTSTYSETYQWNFSNATSSNSKEPIVTFVGTEAGDTAYSVQLIAKSWLGCVDTAYAVRKVFAIPYASFSVDTNEGCYPLTVRFSNQSNSNGASGNNDIDYLWDFGNGNTDTAFTPTTQSFEESKTKDSVYYVSLNVTSSTNCSATFWDTITVYPKPTIAFVPSDSAGCGVLQNSFDNKSVPNNSGSINLMRFVWNFGNGDSSENINPTATFSSSSTKDTFYQVGLVGFTEHGCVDSIKHTIQVYPKPLALFTMDTNAGCSPLVVQFSNQSIPFDTSTIDEMTFAWNFGNSTQSTSKNDTIQFYEGGSNVDKIYTIQQISITDHGCKDTMIDSVTIYPTPSSSFSASDTIGCGPLFVSFTNTSALNDTNYWDLGNGFSESPVDTNALFPYALLNDTTYLIRLKTKSKNGCTSDTFNQKVTVWAQPIANYTIAEDSICYYDSFYFTNTSLGATNYFWDLSDGFTSTKENLDYQYRKGKNATEELQYSVILQAISSNNCRDTIEQAVVVHPFTIAQIGNTLDSFCSPNTVNFINNSVNYTDSYWDFNNGDTSDLNEPNYTYQNISSVTRKLRVILRTINQYQCIDRDTIDFKILPEPIADFSPFRLNVCDSGYHTLVNRSINNISNQWSFGDGNTSTEKEPTHLLPRNSSAFVNYTIQLIINNHAGCADTAVENVSMNPFPTIKFDTTRNYSICVGDVVQFNNQSTFAKYHKWSFGDGAISRDSQASYIYGGAGTFTVKYVGYDVNGCADSMSKIAMVTAVDRPKADFTFTPNNPKMPNSLVQFTDMSAPTSGLIYSWDFDDLGASSNAQNPSHTYSDSGRYSVMFIVDNGLCRDTVSKPIYIEPPFPIPNFSSSDTAGCSPFEVAFTQQSIHANRYRWFFNDGSESNEEEPNHTFINEGYYDITLVAYGPGGEVDTTFNQLIRVYPKPFAFFTITEKEKYLPNPFFNLKNESVDGTSYLWEMSDQDNNIVSTSIDEHATFEPLNPGQFSIQLETANKFGCKDTFVRPLYLTVFDSGYVFVPSAFSPTKTPGTNDVFRPIMEGVSTDGYLFQIYNRWGEKIFETQKIDEYWDGVYQGEKSEVEQYIFIVSGRFYNGHPFERKGTVMIVR